MMRGKPQFPPFTRIDHTGDLALEARGRTREELFENAAVGMISFLIDLRTVRTTEELRLEVEGSDAEECLVGWLQEILYHLEVHGRILRRFAVLSSGPPRVRATARGEPLDPARHDLRVQIKAVTYHDLRIREESHSFGPLFTARIVLDI